MQSLCFNKFGNLGIPCVLASKRRRCAKNTERDDDQHCFVHWQMPSCANGHHDSSARPRKPACRFRAMRAWRQERAPGPGACARSAKRLRKRFGSIVRSSGWSRPVPGRSKSKLFRLPCWRSSPNAPLCSPHPLAPAVAAMSSFCSPKIFLATSNHPIRGIQSSIATFTRCKRPFRRNGSPGSRTSFRMCDPRGSRGPSILSRRRTA